MVEFIKDWQTMITGLLAIGAAVIAAYPVYRQLALLRQQTAATSIASMLWAAEATDEEFSALANDAKIYSDLTVIFTRVFKSKPDSWNADFENALNRVIAAGERTFNLNEQNPKESALFEARLRLHTSCRLLSDKLRKIFMYSGEKNSALLPEEIQALDDVEQTLETWEAHRSECMTIMRLERRRYWGKIRELEPMALNIK